MARKYIKPILDTWEDRSMLIINSHRGGGGIPTDGLVAYYPFNGNANDESGNGNDGTVFGATLTTDRKGNANSAYLFDGNDYIVNNNQILNLDNYFSISFWVMLSARLPIARFVSFSNSLDTKPIFSIIDNGGFRGNSNNDSGIGQNTNAYNVGITTSAWYHLTLVRSLDTIDLYIDSILRATGAVSGTHTNNNNITVGALNFGNDVIQFMRGKIDDIRIYNIALTEAGITALYNE